MAMLTRYVNTGSTAGGDGTTNSTSGGTRAYASLREAMDVITTYPSDGYTVYCSGTAADTLSCTQAYLNFVTSPTNYIHIIGDNTTGTWNTSAYRIELTDSHAIYNNYLAHCRIENLQVQITVTTSTGAVYNCYRLATANNQVDNGVIDHRFINCIARGIVSGGTDSIYGFVDSDPGGAGGGSCRRINCLAYGCYSGFQSGTGAAWEIANLINYNCTGARNGTNFMDAQKCINCLATDFTQYGDFLSTGSSGHLNNASEDGSAVGTSSRINQTFTFVNAGADDYHLASTDAGARDYGTTDPGSGLYSTDITGATRSGSWDIGAFEYAAPGNRRRRLLLCGR